MVMVYGAVELIALVHKARVMQAVLAEHDVQ